MTHKKSLVANFSFQFSVVLSQLVVIPFYLSSWGYELYGFWVAATALLMLAAYTDIGFLSVIANLINGMDTLYKRNLHSRFFLSAFWISALTFVLLSIPLNIVVYYLFSDFYSLSLYLYSSYWLFFNLSIFIANAARAQKDYHIYVFINALYKLFEVLLLVLALEFGASKDEICYVYFLTSLLNFITSFACYTLINRVNFDVQVRSVIVRLVTRAYARSFKAFLVPATLAIWLQGSVVVLSKIASSDVVVFFTTTRTLSRLIVQIVNVLNSVFWGRYSVLYKNKRSTESAKLLMIHGRLTYLIVIIFGVVFSTLGELVYQMWLGEMAIERLVFYSIILTSMFSALWTGKAFQFLSTNRHGIFSFHYVLLVVSMLFFLAIINSVSLFYSSILLVEFLMFVFVLILTKKANREIK